MDKRIVIAISIICIIVLGGVFLISTKNNTNQSNLSATPTISSLPTTSPTPMKQYNKPPAMMIDLNKTYTATMVTNKGSITLELFAKETPVTVNNFVFLSREGFYDGTKFHRIIKGFMIQGGDPRGDGTGGPGYKFNDEKITREYTRGTIAMANSGSNTNGSQFFIMHADYPLPKNYVIFGRVTEGLAVVDAIANTPVKASSMGESSVPTEDIILQTVTIAEK